MWMLPIIAYAANASAAVKAAHATDIMDADASAAWALAHNPAGALALAA